MRITNILAAAAIAVAGLSTPAFADTPASDPTPTATPDQPAAASKRYCVVTKVTGSRLERKICKTRTEWMQSEGFDPLSPKK